MFTRLLGCTVLIGMLLAMAVVFSGCATVRVGSPEDAGWDFVDRSLLKRDGRIITYPTDGKPFHQEYGVWPNDVLAETMGLALLYFVDSNRPEAFAKSWWFVENRMISEKSGLVAWKFDATDWKPMPSSAAIDDLRIARALLLAYTQWGDTRYRDAAKKLGNAIYKYEIKRGYPVEFVSWQGDIGASNVVDLGYLDLYTMKLLSHLDPRWEKVFVRSRDLILRSLTEHGLFYDKYDPFKGRFYNQENNLVNKLLCAVHLAEIGVNQEQVIKFIEKEFYNTGKIKGRYDAASGKATVAYDAVGVYALALQFAILYDREALIDMLMAKILKYQKRDGARMFLGCFGQENCHAFDTLNVLLAFKMLPPGWRQLVEMKRS